MEHRWWRSCRKSITKDSSVQSISSMSFDQVGGYADTDTTPPGLSALSWAFNSSGIRDRDHDDKSC